MKNLNEINDLNANELIVLTALVGASDGNGHDFGFTEDAWRTHIGDLDESVISKKQFSGYVSQLTQKGYIRNLAEHDKSWTGGFQLTKKGFEVAEEDWWMDANGNWFEFSPESGLDLEKSGCRS